MNDVKPLFPWMGGKRRLAQSLLPLFPEHTCYVEPFCGGAALFFMKRPSEAEVINDINGDIVNLFRVVKNHAEELARQFAWTLPSREVFRRLQLTNPETLTDIQRAARFLYLQKMAFGGKAVGQAFGTSTTTPPKLNAERLLQDLKAACDRLANVTIERLNWEECVRRYDRPDTFFYCDPPYWETEGYGVDFPLDAYERLAKTAREIQGKMMISVNDHPAMRETFFGLQMEPVRIGYSLAGGKRSQRKFGELVIRNWKESQLFII
ncbi:MAG: DNA adenine methylase [Oxalobacter formigenes]|nr:DNA adenine methylase [Oxalobacter formigenes]